MEYDSRLLAGRDLLSDCNPLVFWNDGCWVTDRGRWDAQNKVYTPADGYKYDQNYIDGISAEVRNRIKFSADVVKTDYYRYIVG